MRSIKAKIVLLAAFAAVVTALGLSIVFVAVLGSASDEQIHALETSLREDFDRLVKSEVETAVSMLDRLAALRDAGSLSAREAERLAADLLRSLRFGVDGYFWADTRDGTNVVLLGSATEGTNRIGAKDVKGFEMVRAIIDVGLKGGGYTDYWFPRAGQTVAAPKRSYSLHVKGFDWVVGTGNYIDDIDELVEQKRQEAAATRAKALLVVGLVAAALSLVMAALAVLLGGRISRPLAYASIKVRELAEGRLGASFDSSLTQGKDEAALLVAGIQDTLRTLRDVVMSVQEASGTILDGSGSLSEASQQMSLGLGEIADSSQQLSQGSTEQAASAEEVSASVEEMSANIRQNADNAFQTEKIATKAAGGAIQRHERAAGEPSRDGRRHGRATQRPGWATPGSRGLLLHRGGVIVKTHGRARRYLQFTAISLNSPLLSLLCCQNGCEV